jgi:ribosomal protein L37AE/L43A
VSRPGYRSFREPLLPKGDREMPRVVVPAPVSCPFCQSADLKTKSKSIDESTYWRCAACGEIWNPGRLNAGNTGRRWH